MLDEMIVDGVWEIWVIRNGLDWDRIGVFCALVDICSNELGCGDLRRFREGFREDFSFAGLHAD